MDEELILHEIVKSLAFEIEAVNQDNVLKWTSTNGTPLNVKVRVRNKDEPRLIQKGAIPVPRIGITAPEKLRLISSDQTILSFNVYLEGLQKDSKRDNGLKKFITGNCLRTYSDDEGPYLPGSSDKNAIESDSCSETSSDILKKNVPPVVNTTDTALRSQKNFFGKCKPGGCLDPPFDEDNYAYSLSNADRKDNVELELTRLDNNTKKHAPGGCLDPPFSEDKYPYTNSRDQQESLAKHDIKSQLTKETKQILGKKCSEELVQRKTKDKIVIKDQEYSKNLTYARTSKEDSIITYPTDLSSNETLYDPNKKISIRSNDDGAQKHNSYDYPVSYFVPPKDVTRNKDGERRYSRRASSETINSKGSKSSGTEYTLHNALRSKNIEEKNSNPNYYDDVATKSYHTNQKDVLAIKQDTFHAGLLVKAPAHTNAQENESNQNLPSVSVCKEHATMDLKPSEGNSNHEIPHYHKQTISPSDSEKSSHVKRASVEKNINIQHWQTQQMPIAEANHKPNDILPQVETSCITSDQTEGGYVARNEKLDTESIKQLKQNEDNSKFSETRLPIINYSKPNLSCDNDDSISKKIIVTEATIPLLATTLALSENQPIGLDEKLNDRLDNSIIIKDGTTITKTASDDLTKNTTKQRQQSEHSVFKNMSPQRMSSSENNDFDVSSEHSIDSKHELSSNTAPQKREITLSHKDKHAEILNSKSIDNVMITKNVSSDYIKEPETKKTSEILYKKPFTARHNMDIEQDDIDETTPLKRKTFTVMSSNTSIQKREEIEEIPENIPDVYSKSIVKSEIVSPDTTLNRTNVSDANNKNPDRKSSPTQKSVAGIPNYLYTTVNDDTIPAAAIEKAKDIETKFKTNFDENQTHVVSEHVTDIESTNNRTRPTNMIQNENKISIHSLQNPMPIDVRDIHSEIVDSYESVSTAQSEFESESLKANYQENGKANYEDIDSLYRSHNRQDFDIIRDKANVLDTGNQIMEKVLINQSSRDLLQNSNYDKTLKAKVSFSDKSDMTQTSEYVDLRKRKSDNMSSISSNISVQNKYSDNLRSTAVTNSKFDTNSTHELVPEYVRDLYPEVNIKSASFSQNPEVQKVVGFIPTEAEMKTSNTISNSDNSAIDISQKRLPNDLQSDDSANYASDKIYHYKNYENSNLDATQGIEGELVQDYDIVMTNQNNEPIGRNHLEYENLDRDNSPHFIPIPELTKNVEYFDSQSDDSANYASDKIYHYKNYENSNLDATQGIEGELVQDYDIVMTNKNNETIGRNNLEYENLDRDNSPHFIPIPELTKNVEYLKANNVDHKNIANIDQKEDKYEPFDTRHDENPKHIKPTENISELPSFTNAQDMENKSYELKGTDNLIKHSPRPSEYSDLISGVLSNISEHKEEEENNALQNTILEETTQRQENIVPFNNKPSPDQGVVDNKYKNISNEYKLPSSIKSSVSTLKESNKYKNKEKIPEDTRKGNITSTFDELRQRLDADKTDSAKLNTSRDGVFHGNTRDIIGQTSKYPSSQTLTSIPNLNVLSKRHSEVKQVSALQTTHYKQPKLQAQGKSDAVVTGSSSFREEMSPLYLDMSFYSYLNDNKQRIVQTQNPRTESQTSNNGIVTIVKTLIRHGNEIRIPVDTDNDITLNVLDKDVKVQSRKSNVGLPINQTRRDKNSVDRAKNQNDVLNKHLSLIYESKLIPLHSVIKNLTHEVNALATKQEILQTRMRNIKRAKSLRLIPVVKRCGCRRI